MKPGRTSIVNKKHPEWGTFGVMRKYDEGIWEIRGRGGDRTLNEGELRFWELARKASLRSATIRLASELPVGSPGRKQILDLLQRKG